ncbi:metallophosphoesterase family protein [Roseococcus sp. YIM B11640]|uniref:metallophosphoesterase family protein n=1 Tax=Roseococcus sp. YIM B11640 TaxID=3133973 RepID=UPI003C7ABCD1
MTIAALRPRGEGHRFVLYADACSGVPGAPHEANLARVNAVLARLSPPPEFILFPGDEVIGLTPSADVLAAQWRHFLGVEMEWSRGIPVYHTTGNHTAYDRMSEDVFRAALPHLPRNGPPGQEGLSYSVRRGDLAMIFVHTLWTGLGGEGQVETEWLREELHRHRDARHRLVLGHHPAFTVNGFQGDWQREIGPGCREAFWDALVEGDVLAYLCSHILAFDVQVHRGVLQVTTGGAGTAHRMPEGVEYLHALHAALDAEGLRYEVLDDSGSAREGLSWPLRLPPAETWKILPHGVSDAAFTGIRAAHPAPRICALGLRGRTSSVNTAAQTLFAAQAEDRMPAVWMGLRGPEQRLCVILAAAPGRSPSYWFGPALGAGREFSLELLLHGGMGPGGVMWREGPGAPWNSLRSAASWGAERIDWPSRWEVGAGFAGEGLELRFWSGLP